MSETSRGRRHFSGITNRVLQVVTIVFPLYLLLYISGVFNYINVFIYPIRHNALTLMVVLALTYVLYPANRGAPRDRLPWYDALAVLLSIVVNLYIMVYCIQIVERPYAPPSLMEQAFTVILVTLILEAVRRTTGWILTSIGIVFFLYPFFTGFLPGFLFSRPQSLARVAEMVYIFPQGIYGRLIDIFATLIAAFLLFGTFFQASGAGEFLSSIATATAGRFRGGPAKVSELASALFGTISGSGIANVALTGPVTIPMMKKVGYQAHYAAAVEAVASNGGQIMPPVLGTAAFLMMDFLGVGYSTIMAASLVPAVLYFAALFFMLDFQAAKMGLRGLPREELPSARKVLKHGWPYMIPVLLLVLLISAFAYSPETSCVYTILLIVAGSWLVKGRGMKWQQIKQALSRGMQEMPSLGVTVAMVSILVGAVELTGVGVRISGGLVTIAGNSLFFLLVLTALSAMVLGMGMPTAAVYVLCALLMAPALVRVGIEPLVAHMFVFYYGIAAMITPPVCLTAFVAAAIAGAPFMKTGWQASRLGVVVFIVPFIFAYFPQLVMIGSPGEILLASFTAFLGVLCLSAGLEGYLLVRAGWLQRILFLAAGILLMIPRPVTLISGTVLFLLVSLWQITAKRALAARKTAT